jgi:O-antigen/teichoic acid export membrane protein
MACVSGISLLKLGILATILSRSDFALYAMVFAAVAFASEVVSFGLTQATVKKYPRLAAYNRAGEILADLRDLARKLLIRYAALYLLLAAGAWYYASGAGLIALTGMSLIAIGTNLFGVIASICRAFDQLNSLAAFGIARTLMATTAAISIAMNSSWEAVLLGEGLVTVSVGLAIIWRLRNKVIEHEHRNQVTRTADDLTRFVSGPRDGILTFVSFLLLTLPSSFDRLFVASLADLKIASSYAFAGIWVTASIAIVGIYTQKLGPDVVRLRAMGQMAAPLAYVMPRALALSAILFLGAFASFSFLYLFMQDTLWLKYEMNWSSAITVSILAAMMVSAIFDWTLLALDGEKYLLFGGVILVASCIVLFFIAGQLDLGLTGFLGAAICSRLAHLGWQIVSISKLQINLQNDELLDPQSMSG